MLSLAVLTVVTMIVLQLLVLIVAMLFVYPHSNLAAVAQKPILLLVSQFLIYAAVAAGMVMLVEGKYHVAFWPAIKWKWPQSGAWKFLGLGAGMLIVLGTLQSVLPMPKRASVDDFFAQLDDAVPGVGPVHLQSTLAHFMQPSLPSLPSHAFVHDEVRLGCAHRLL